MSVFENGKIHDFCAFGYKALYIRMTNTLFFELFSYLVVTRTLNTDFGAVV